MGRPERLTPERQERFLEAIRRGAFPEVAARYAGFSPASYYRYMKGATPEHAAYRDAVIRADAELEVHLGGVMKLAADTSPTGRPSWPRNASLHAGVGTQHPIAGSVTWTTSWSQLIQRNLNSLSLQAHRAISR